MKGYNVVGYAYNGDIYCPDCGSEFSEEEKTPIFADTEFDFIPVCAECGTELEDYSLTREGLLSEFNRLGDEIIKLGKELKEGYKKNNLDAYIIGQEFDYITDKFYDLWEKL